MMDTISLLILNLEHLLIMGVNEIFVRDIHKHLLLFDGVLLFALGFHFVVVYISIFLAN